jgi:hypothetical protein
MCAGFVILSPGIYFGGLCWHLRDLGLTQLMLIRELLRLLGCPGGLFLELCPRLNLLHGACGTFTSRAASSASGCPKCRFKPTRNQIF